MIMRKQQIEQTFSPNEVGIRDCNVGNNKHIQYVHLSKYSIGGELGELLNYQLASGINKKETCIIDAIRSHWTSNLPSLVYRLLQ